MSDYISFSNDLLDIGHRNIKKHKDLVKPSHVIAAKKVEIEERKLKMQEDALRMAVMKHMLGGKEVVDGELTTESQERLVAGQE